MKARTVLLAIGTGLVSQPGIAGELPEFKDVTDEAGVRFTHSLGDSALSNIVEGTGPGGLWFDFNNDDLLDLYFINGCWHPDVSDNRGRSLKGQLANALFQNIGGGRFRDVTGTSRTGDRGYGMAASSADYDNDGDLDLYVVNFGPNVLYRNNGDGTFTDVTGEAGLADPGWGVAGVWFDYDRDGDDDLFVCNYLEYDQGAFQRYGAYYPAENYPGPLAYRGQPDHLYRNNGDGTFTDVTKAAGLLDPNGRGMGAVACDFDGDGAPDLFVTNDAMPNTLWINDGKGRFTERGTEQGLAFGEGGQGVSSMGPVVGDADGDGRFDVLIPDMAYSCLMFQKAGGLFMDGTTQSGLALICGQYTGWGGLLFDYNNDSWLDIFIANGDAHHLYPEEAVLARSDGQGRFLDVAKESGTFFARKHVSRGSAYADYDNDGDLDVVVFNVNQPPCLLRNDGGNRQNWLKVVPVWSDTRQVALGAQITVSADGIERVAPVLSANGYLSGSDPRPHFGLGSTTQVDWVRVVWPDGAETRLSDVPANQIVKVTRERPKPQSR